MLIDKIKAMPEEERLKRAEEFKSVIGIILYFVMLNNPSKAVLIKLLMRIFNIPDDIFDDLEALHTDAQ